MTSSTKDVRSAAEQLRSDRRAFVAATVVLAERPTSARAGDTALVMEDGTVVGFVGGECAQASVQTQALAALATGRPILLRISPDAPDPSDPSGLAIADPEAGVAAVSGGTVTVHNPCLSGGTLEIFLEPEMPPPLVLVVGDAPIARAVRELAEWMGYDARTAPADPAPSGALPPDGADAVIVASHGGDEHAVLRAAIDAGVPYIGLVASPRRGAAVLDALGLAGAQRDQISTPAGFDIGARSAQEVALSILAEVVAKLPTEPHPARHRPDEAAGDAPVATATDPVCGMAVAMVERSRHVDHEGVRWWFCGSGCEQAFRADPAAFGTP